MSNMMLANEKTVDESMVKDQEKKELWKTLDSMIYDTPMTIQEWNVAVNFLAALPKEYWKSFAPWLAREILRKGLYRFTNPYSESNPKMPGGDKSLDQVQWCLRQEDPTSAIKEVEKLKTQDPHLEIVQRLDELVKVLRMWAAAYEA